MSLIIHGAPGSAEGLVAAMRLVATARGQRPFTGESAELVRAMAGVASAAQGDGPSADLHQLLGSEEPWSNDRQAVTAIATWLPGSDARSEAVHAALLIPLSADELDVEGLHAARWLAKELGADDRTVRDVEATCRRNAVKAEADLVRRFLAWKTGVDPEVIKARLARHEPPLLTPARDLEGLRRSLEQAADGTVGGELRRFYGDTGFFLPGSPGVLPLEVLGAHDVHHVLTAYDSSPEDEVYLAVFSAANAVDGGMDYLAVIMLQWHQGIRLGVFDPAKATLNPQLLAAAALRGDRTTTDLCDRSWDYRSLLDLPLDDAREQLGIPAGGSVVAGGPWDARHHLGS